MRAAAYVRLSKEDREGARSGIESCLVQQRNAERAIDAQGWHLIDGGVFVDDDISGAEILRRPKLQAMLALAQGRHFDVLVLRDLDRLARDAARQAALLVQLADAGVRVWSYADGAFVQLDGFGYLLTAVKGVVAEQERAKAAQRIREALRFRVQAGRRASRAPYGYTNVRDETGAAHWKIDPDAAAAVVQLGETFVRCGSFRATAVALNHADVPAATGGSWSPQGVRNVLLHPLYRGEYRHGESRTVARGGTLVKQRAPEAEILRIPHPELRIWPEALRTQIDALLAKPRRSVWGAATPRHLASSFLRCGLCGSSVTVTGSKRRNNVSYICARHLLRGRSACPGIGYRNESAVDRALLAAIKPFVDGEVAERALTLIERRLEAYARADGREAARVALARDLAAADRKAKNLSEAIARGGELEPLLAALREQTDRIDLLKKQRAELETSPPASLDTRRTVFALRQRLRALSKLLSKGGIEARPVLAAVLGTDRVTATPIEVQGQKRWQLTGQISGGYLVSNVVKEASAWLPSCAALRELPCALRPQPPWPRP